jgi:hypothetical protein
MSIHVCDDNLATIVATSGIAAGFITVCHFYHQWHARNLLVAPSKNCVETIVQAVS